ncbi:MAG: acyl-CoA reductase [Flavobacteriales bacterium]
MNLRQRKEAFVQLGKVLKMLDDKKYPVEEAEKLEAAIKAANLENEWFQEDQVRSAIRSIVHVLEEGKLNKWIEKYEDKFSEEKPFKNVLVIMAGNIPLVGFHDMLCVLICGHKLLSKLSSKDERILPSLCDLLIALEPSFKEKISFTEGQITEKIDAVIATGSNNTSRYFDYYFGQYPNIIRKNKNGVAILSGDETTEELYGLGDDIFRYFGLGCRNVSKLYVPEDYDLDIFFKGVYKYKNVIDNPKYYNNYNYQRAVHIIDRESIWDNGFVLLKEDERFASPTGMLYFERYKDEGALRRSLEKNKDRIQCIISKKDIPFGQAQEPKLWEYADDVDTMEFLLGD